MAADVGVLSRRGRLARFALGAYGALIYVFLFGPIVLLVLFSFILRLKFGVELGPAGFLFAQPDCCPPQLTLYNATTVGSFLLTAAVGLATAAWKFRRWRPLA